LSPASRALIRNQVFRAASQVPIFTLSVKADYGDKRVVK